MSCCWTALQVLRTFRISVITGTKVRRAITTPSGRVLLQFVHDVLQLRGATLEGRIAVNALLHICVGENQPLGKAKRELLHRDQRFWIAPVLTSLCLASERAALSAAAVPSRHARPTIPNAEPVFGDLIALINTCVAPLGSGVATILWPAGHIVLTAQTANRHAIISKNTAGKGCKHHHAQATIHCNACGLKVANV